jgi:hypothetical protein
MGRIYRETTPAMLARVTDALNDRLARALDAAAKEGTGFLNRRLGEPHPAQRHVGE